MAVLMQPREETWAPFWMLQAEFGVPRWAGVRVRPSSRNWPWWSPQEGQGTISGCRTDGLSAPRLGYSGVGGGPQSPHHLGLLVSLATWVQPHLPFLPASPPPHTHPSHALAYAWSLPGHTLGAQVPQTQPTLLSALTGAFPERGR